MIWPKILAERVLSVAPPSITHCGVIKSASDRVTFPFNSHLGCDLRNASCKAIKRLLEYDDSWMNKRSVCQVYIKIECSSMNIIVPISSEALTFHLYAWVQAPVLLSISCLRTLGDIEIKHVWVCSCFVKRCSTLSSVSLAWQIISLLECLSA